MPRLARSLLAAVAALFIATPVMAYAMPERGPVGTSSLAGTVSPPAVPIDLRTADARDAGAPAAAAASDLRTADARDAVPVSGGRLNPVPVAAPSDDGFPFGSVAIIGLAGLVIAGMGYAVNVSGRTGRSRLGV